MGFFKKQFLDVIQWLDDSDNTLAYMYPMQDQEIQNGAKLTVRQGQVAIFVDKGEIADVFGPGMYTLTTENLPILTNLKHWSYGFKSPFKADVYFLNMKEYLDNKWGTSNPIWIPDTQFGQVQVRAHGTYAFKIKDPVNFLRNIVGTKSKYRLEDITSQLRGFIVTQFSNIVGNLHLSVSQIAANYNAVGDAMKETVAVPFENLGLSITHLTISNIGLPEEIEKHLKELTGMNIMGSIQSDKLSKVQILKQLSAMENAAKHGGSGMMQAGMEMQMGIQMAQAYTQPLQQTQQTQTTQPTAPTAEETCPKCGAKIKKGSKFCSECGAKIERPTKKFCVNCGAAVSGNMKFCPECGAKLG